MYIQNHGTIGEKTQTVTVIISSKYYTRGIEMSEQYRISRIMAAMLQVTESLETDEESDAMLQCSKVAKHVRSFRVES